MASRKIFLEDGLAHWEYQRSQWHEDLVQGVELNKYIEQRFREVLAGFSMLNSLSNKIGKYNDLELRYEEEALPGIMGLLSVLSRHLGRTLVASCTASRKLSSIGPLDGAQFGPPKL